MGVGNVSGTGDSVGAGIAVDVSVGVLVSVGIGVDEEVAVSGAEVEDGVATVGLALSVDEGVAGSEVEVAGTSSGRRDCAGRIEINKNRKINRRMIATINLKRS